MKMLIMLATLMGALAASADDSYIFWMIGSNPTMEGVATPATWDKVTAKVSAFQFPIESGTDWVYGGGTYLNLYTVSSGSVGSYIAESKEVGVGGINPSGISRQYAASIGTMGSGWSYFVELYNDGAIFARSDSLPYSQEYVAGLSGLSTAGKLWGVSAFMPAAVPEPNSAILLLLGLAGLALRRQRKV